MNIYGNILNKILANRIKEHTKKNHPLWSSRLHLKADRIVQDMNTFNVVHHINKLKERKQIFSLKAQEASDKIHYSFMIKVL